jgi:gamma-glutamyltranspeptidase/glutathione hydrolase
MSLQDAIAAPRFHYQGGALEVEGRITQEVRQELRRKGYRLQVGRNTDFIFGGVHAIVRSGNQIHGGADPRRDGLAMGY